MNAARLANTLFGPDGQTHEVVTRSADSVDAYAATLDMLSTGRWSVSVELF